MLITKVFTHHPESTHGNQERNVGMERVMQLADRHNNDSHNSNGLVYFLEDDNTLFMELCQDDVRAILSTNNNVYYADQYSCGEMRLPSSNFSKEWQTDPTSFSLSDKMDTGNWRTPGMAAAAYFRWQHSLGVTGLRDGFEFFHTTPTRTAGIGSLTATMIVCIVRQTGIGPVSLLQ